MLKIDKQNYQFLEHLNIECVLIISTNFPKKIKGRGQIPQ